MALKNVLRNLRDTPIEWRFPMGGLYREPAGHVRVSEIWVPVRRGPPKIIAHRPILIERAAGPQCPRDCNYGGKADKASEADQHDVEIIAWNLADRPGRAELKSSRENAGSKKGATITPASKRACGEGMIHGVLDLRSFR